MYVIESSNVTQIEVCHSSTHRLAFLLNWHKLVVEQDSFNKCVLESVLDRVLVSSALAGCICWWSRKVSFL